MNAPEVAVVGAGIAGLTAAHVLASGGAAVTVLEKASQPGGKIRTESFAGVDLDVAADAFLARVPEATELCRDLGLGDQLVTPATRGAFLLLAGELRRFPDGLVLGVPTDLEALARSGLLSTDGMRRVEADLVTDGAPLDGDTSVGRLVRDRLGDEAFEVLVEPLLSGVNAGDADQLSVRAGAPQFAAALQDQPSLIAGLRSQQRTLSDPDAPVFYGLQGGTTDLITALVSSIRSHGATMHLGVEATSLDPQSDGRTDHNWSITATDGTKRAADAVVVATPTGVTARLLRSAGVATTVCDGLDALRYASVAMIVLAFDQRTVAHPLDGTGFLVGRREGLLTTACSWASSKWAHLNRSGQVILRVSAGRSGDERALELDDDALVATVVEELRGVLGITGQPTERRVTRWPDALPQFAPGHLDRIAAWRTAVGETHPGIELIGAGFDGLGIPACIRQGQAAADRILNRTQV